MTTLLKTKTIPTIVYIKHSFYEERIMSNIVMYENNEKFSTKRKSVFNHEYALVIDYPCIGVSNISMPVRNKSGTIDFRNRTKNYSCVKVFLIKSQEIAYINFDQYKKEWKEIKQ